MPALLRLRLKTLAIAALGAALFFAAGLPLPFLFGPMAACLVAALAGQQMQGLGLVTTLARTILGVAVGASITPEVAHQLPRMAVTLAIVPFYVALIGLIGYPYFRRVAGFDRPTAWYAAMPGGLQDMVLFGQEAGGDVRALSLVHATRVLIIVTAAPFFFTLLLGGSLDAPVGEPATAIPLHELGLMALAALLGWKVAERLKLFGASILGPLIATAALSLAGLIHHRPPQEAIWVAQFFIGMVVGVYYVGITWAELRRVVVMATGFVALIGALAAAIAFTVAHAGVHPPLDVFLAFAPGGQAELAVLAIVAGADLGFIVAHHLLRLVLVILCAPLAFRLTRDRPGQDRHR